MDYENKRVIKVLFGAEVACLLLMPILFFKLEEEGSAALLLHLP
jgi:hypothetical protein